MATTCANCGQDLPDDSSADPATRIPCPACGGVKRNYSVASSGVAAGLSGGVAKMDVRASLTATFLVASAGFARRAAQIEKDHPQVIDEQTRVEHLGLVISSVMQSVAAIEAESWELTTYGPGHHLGSNGIDAQALAFLKPLADVIDGESALNRYKTILHLLQKAPLAPGAQPWQDTDLLVRLRNELVHYKSKWGEEMGGQKLFKSLKQLNLPKPPFVQNTPNFFPRECLSAACAAWAVRTATAFLNEVYAKLGVASPLLPYAAQLSTP